MTNEIQKLCSNFTTQLIAHVEERAVLRAGDIVLEAFKLHPNAKIARAAGARPKPAARREAMVGRRKGPIQLCPVPGCMMRAAPVFGMVCAGHKDVPKAKIAKYREARRASKAA